MMIQMTYCEEISMFLLSIVHGLNFVWGMFVHSLCKIFYGFQ